MTLTQQAPSAPPTMNAGTAQGGAIASPYGSYGKGVLCCLIATISFGLMFPVMSEALKRIDPFTMTSLRYLIAGIVSLVLLRIAEGRDGLQFKGESIALAWLLGSIGFAGFGFFVFLGQQLAGRDGALTTSILAATQPMMGILVNSLLRRILPSRYAFLFVLLSFFGVALVITKGDLGGLLNAPGNYSSTALIILGMLSWIIYTFSGVYFSKWSVLKYTTLTMLLGLTTIILINALLFASHAIAFPSAQDLAAIIPHLLYMSLIASCVGVLLWNLGNKIISPVNGVLFMNVVPITAFAVSSVAGVLPTSFQIMGACITGTALVANNLYSRYSARRT